jgi:O-antigen ligase
MGMMFILILIPSNLKSIVILLFGIFILYNAFKKKTPFNLSFFLNYSLLYIVILLTLLYCKNMQQGLYFLQTMSSLAIFPLCFSFISKEDFKKLPLNLFIWIFLISLFLFHMIVFSWFSITEFSINDTLIHFQEIVTLRLGRLSIHPIYIAMQCCIALFLSAILLSNKIKISHKILLFILQASMIGFIILHAKKGPIAAFLIAIFCCFIIFHKRIKLKKVVPVFLILLVLFFSIPSVKNRFLEIFTTEKLTDENANSTNIRVAVYQNTLQLLKKAPFFGYGLGDHNEVLLNNYKANNQKVLLEKNYNSHNQYLSFLLIGGPIILLLYFYFFYTNINLGITKNNTYFVLILLFYSFVMFTENILERENGVIFFSFFLSYFGYKNYNEIYES